MKRKYTEIRFKLLGDCWLAFRLHFNNMTVTGHLYKQGDCHQNIFTHNTNTLTKNVVYEKDFDKQLSGLLNRISGFISGESPRSLRHKSLKAIRQLIIGNELVKILEKSRISSGASLICPECLLAETNQVKGNVWHCHMCEKDWTADRYFQKYLQDGCGGKNIVDITVAMVKALRNETGFGMLECKKALTENGGNAEAAKDALRRNKKSRRL